MELGKARETIQVFKEIPRIKYAEIPEEVLAAFADLEVDREQARRYSDYESECWQDGWEDWRDL